MNKKLFLLSFIVVATAMLVTSCQKEEGTVTLGAEIQKPVSGNAKVYIDDHTPCWHNGDEVFINNTAYPIMAATGSTARIENVVSASAYRAIFPASIVPTGSDISSSGGVPVTLPSVQHYELVNGRQRVDVPMGAYITSGNTLQFYNLCSVVRVTVSNSLSQELPLRSIVLQAENAMLSGAGTATIGGQSSDIITLSSTARHDVSLGFTNEFPTTVEALGTGTFDIVMPAFDANDVLVKVYTTDGQCYTVTKENVALASNTITTVTINVTELTEVPHAELVNGTTFKNALSRDFYYVPYRTIFDDGTGDPYYIYEDVSVVFEYNSSVASGTLLSTPNSPVPIYGNLDGTIYRISTSASIIDANPYCREMFHTTFPAPDRHLPEIVIIDFGHGFNTLNVEDMSYMFWLCGSLTSLDLSSFNTSNVHNMAHMFDGCRRLTSLDVSNFNTSNVRGDDGLGGLNNMFAECSSLTSLDVSNFNTSNVYSMAGMFSGCSSLTSLDVSNFNTSNVYSMDGMFGGCSSLTSLDVSNFNTSNVYLTMSYMFEGCSSLTVLDLSNFNTSNVSDMSSMFKDCNSLTFLDLSGFNMSDVTEDIENYGEEIAYSGGRVCMCCGLSTTSGHCTITCPLSVENALKELNPYYGNDNAYSLPIHHHGDGHNTYYMSGLPTSGVTFTWVRP